MVFNGLDTDFGYESILRPCQIKGLIRERLAMTSFSSLFAEGILCLRDLMIQSDVTSNWQAILSIPEYAAVLFTRVLFQFCLSAHI